MESYRVISEASGQWSGLILDPAIDPEEDEYCIASIYLLILESRCIKILYALLLEKIFTTELREKVIKVRSSYYHDCELADARS